MLVGANPFKTKSHQTRTESISTDFELAFASFLGLLQSGGIVWTSLIVYE